MSNEVAGGLSTKSQLQDLSFLMYPLNKTLGFSQTLRMVAELQSDGQKWTLEQLIKFTRKFVLIGINLSKLFLELDQTILLMMLDGILQYYVERSITHVLAWLGVIG